VCVLTHAPLFVRTQPHIPFTDAFICSYCLTVATTGNGIHLAESTAEWHQQGELTLFSYGAIGALSAHTTTDVLFGWPRQLKCGDV
jgi:hypothetical protein